jgi:hypothetical protein
MGLDVEYFAILHHHSPGVVVDHVGRDLLPCAELVQAHFLVRGEFVDGLFHGLSVVVAPVHHFGDEFRYGRPGSHVLGCGVEVGDGTVVYGGSGTGMDEGFQCRGRHRIDQKMADSQLDLAGSAGFMAIFIHRDSSSPGGFAKKTLGDRSL